MNRATKKRLRDVSRSLEAMPIAPEVEERAFQQFRETGELPDYERLAAAVVKRALRAQAVGTEPRTFEESVRRLAKLVEQGAESQPEPICEYLFGEAVHGSELVRHAARAAIKLLVSIGRDVTDPGFIDEEVQLPDFGTVGLYLLGWPEILAKPPYEDQAHRLFDRFAGLREQTTRDEAWYEELAEAWSQFRDHGRLPDEELMCEVVLAYAEYVGLLGHCLGKGDPEMMAAFDEVVQATGEDRVAAMSRLQALAAEGRLVCRRA